LATRFAPRVRQRLLRLLGAAQDLDDLVQDVFLQVFRSLRRLLHPHALEAFVLAVANNVARAEIRRRRVRRCIGLLKDGDAAEGAEAPTVTPDPQGREAFARLHRILGRLPVQEQAAFVLRFAQDRDLTAVAAKLGVSLATAKRRSGAAWKKVRAAMSDDPALAAYLTPPGPQDPRPARR
jgi:RNA polymerase sigma-70 factor (ECF subfamily)